MSNPETILQKAIMDAINASGLARVWRQNVGVTKGGRVRFGLCKGSSDLIGLTKHGRFVAIEVKCPGGKATPEQMAFIDEVSRMWGIGLVATSAEQALDYIDGINRSEDT